MTLRQDQETKVQTSGSLREFAMSPYVSKAPTDVASAEQEVENAVRTTTPAPSMGELVARVAQQRAIDEAAIREAIWRMISAGKLALAPDRRIIVTSSRR